MWVYFVLLQVKTVEALELLMVDKLLVKELWRLQSPIIETKRPRGLSLLSQVYQIRQYTNIQIYKVYEFTNTAQVYQIQQASWDGNKTICLGGLWFQWSFKVGEPEFWTRLQNLKQLLCYIEFGWIDWLYPCFNKLWHFSFLRIILVVFGWFWFYIEATQNDICSAL